MKYALNTGPGPERLKAAMLIGAVLLAVLCGALTAAATASASDCQDTFDCYSLAEAYNGSQTFKASAQFDVPANINGYTLQANERANCQATDGGLVWGNNSAWYRFDAGVTGTLTVSATTGTPGFSIMLVQYEAAHEDPINYQSNADLPSRQCSASGPTVHFDSPVQMPVHTSGPTFIQLLASCGETYDGTNPCPNPKAGGPVTLHFAFTPTDTDGDGIPDTLDKCPTVPAATSTGCPPPPPPTDTDGDGVPDVLDHCQTVPGPAKYNGCPDSDGDGIPDPLDLCPHVPGPASAGGCPDADHDGIPDSRDRCKNLFAVVGYSTVGDGRRGCPEPLAVEINYGFRPGPKFLVMNKLAVGGAPRASRITVLCSGARCPKRKLISFVTKKAGNFVLLRRLRSTRLGHGRQIELPAGDRLTIEVTFKGTLGRRRTIVALGNDHSRISAGCLKGVKQIPCPV